jgi:hypothetical protein
VKLSWLCKKKPMKVSPETWSDSRKDIVWSKRQGLWQMMVLVWLIIVLVHCCQ